jgi:hypothetical protein
MLGLLLVPAVWSGLTVAQGDGGGMPSGGPRTAFGFGRPFTAGAQATVQRSAPGAVEADQASIAGSGDPPAGGLPAGGGPGAPPFGFSPDAAPGYQNQLVAFLDAHRNGSQFLLAVPSAMQASPIVIQTGEPVMAMGGFSGGDPILSAADVATDVARNTIRYFLLPDRGNTRGGPLAGGPPGPFGGNSSAVQWVQANCTVVPQGDWGGSSGGAARGGFGGAQQLYDCGPRVGAG